MKELIKELRKIVEPRCSFKFQFLFNRHYHEVDDKTMLLIIKYIIRKLNESLREK